MLGITTNFDELKTLAKNDPQMLERLRKQEIERIIASAPAQFQQRLRGLQFQIDCKRDLQKSPMGACIAISEMMHESLGRLNAVLNGNTAEKTDEKNGKVLSFPVAS